MADQNNLNKPDLQSDYSGEVLQTIRGHIARLWSGNYTGMSGLIAGMRRFVVSGNDLQLKERNADGSETTIFTTEGKATTEALSLVSTAANEAKASTLSVKTTNFTVEQVDAKLVFKFGTTAIASLDQNGNLITKADMKAFNTP